jgi:hypothetical protein
MKRGLFWGGLLVLLGTIFLLDSLGVFDTFGVSAWGLILPAILILLGIWIIWGITTRRNYSETGQLLIPDEVVQQVDLTINHGAGRLLISANQSQINLVEGTYHGGMQQDTSRTSNSLRVKLSMQSDFLWNIPVFWEPRNGFEWDLKFKPGIKYSLELNTGASEAKIDLTDLLIDRISLKTGASGTELTLPQSAGFTSARIQSGAASLSIKVPENVEARIRVTGGLMDLDIDKHRFPWSGTYYQSSDYDRAEHRVDLDVTTGVGSVKIR